MNRQKNALAMAKSSVSTSQRTAATEIKASAAESATGSESMLTPEFLLEHLEGELEPSLQDDLELLLMNSVADRGILKSLEQTREILRGSMDVLLPEDGHFYERMHASIMTAVMAEATAGGAEKSIERQADFGRSGQALDSESREREVAKRM